MTKPHPTPAGTRHLVAPELRPVLDHIPALTIDDGLVPLLRSVGENWPQPLLTDAQRAVTRTRRSVPRSDGAPEQYALVYTPAGGDGVLRPAYVFIHGGGLVSGSPGACDGFCRVVADALDCIVVAPAYRLAPEARFPEARDDLSAAYDWIQANAGELGIDPARIALGGQSAGGCHAATLALHIRDTRRPLPCFLHLDIPMLDDRTGTLGDPNRFCGEFGWTPALNHFGWSALLGCSAGSDAVPQGAVPARAQTLVGLPSTFLLVGAIDLLAEDVLAFSLRLIREGVPTEVHIIPGAFHGGNIAGPQAPQNRQAQALFHAALARAFAPAQVPVLAQAGAA